MKKKILIGLMMALVLSTAAIAQSGPREERPFHHRERKGLEEKLTLSDDQQIKIDALRIDHIKATKELQDQLNEKEVKLNSLLNDDSIDQKAVEKLVNEIGEVKTKLMLARVDHRIKVRALLNDDQKVKFDMMANHRHPQPYQGRF